MENTNVVRMINEIKEFVQGKENIYIYGAGRDGIRCKLLLDYLQITCQGFFVTDRTHNADVVCGMPVIQFDKRDCKDNSSGVIIAMQTKYYPEVIEYVGGGNVDFMLYFDSTPIVEITTKIGCSVNCIYCPQKLLINSYLKTDTNKNKIYLEFDAFKEYLSAIPPTVLIRFCGMSEPFLNEACPDMIEYAANMGYSVDCYTTLVGLKLEDIDKVLKCVDTLVLHLPDSSGNACIPITDEYKEKIEKVFNYNSNVRNVIPIMACHGKIHPEVAKLIPADMKYVLWDEMQDRAGNLEANKEKVLHYNKKGPLICTVNGRNSVVFDSNIMLPNGDLLLCCMDYSLDYIIGNLSKNRYEEILCETKINSVREKMLNSKDDILCRHCNLAKEISV